MLVCRKYVASEYVTKYLRKIEYTPSVMQRKFNDRKFSILSNSRYPEPLQSKLSFYGIIDLVRTQNFPKS